MAQNFNYYGGNLIRDLHAKKITAPALHICPLRLPKLNAYTPTPDSDISRNILEVSGATRNILKGGSDQTPGQGTSSGTRIYADGELTKKVLPRMLKECTRSSQSIIADEVAP